MDINCPATSGYTLLQLSSGKMCVKLYRYTITWAHARQQCHNDNKDGHLVTVDSLEKEHALTDYLYRNHGMFHTNEFYFLWILSMCKLQRVIHKLNKAL